MIFLSTIQISNFKGIKELTCEFEDITLLVGLNNSGKTTILQAVQILIDGLAAVSNHPHVSHPDASSRIVALGKSLSTLGLQDVSQILPRLEQQNDSKIAGFFSNGFMLELRPLNGHNFRFTVALTPDSVSSDIQQLLSKLSRHSAEFVTPPGTVSSREDFMPYTNYQNMLAQGKGGQLWRNAIWWPIQMEGPEAFESVKSLVSRYFPDVEVLLPTMGISNPPEILLNYKERQGATLDISQSGAGLRTFLTLARLLKQSSASILLLDEPDAHLHASQQAVVVDLLMDTALEQTRQIIIATHSQEFIVRSPSECLRWIEPDNSSTQPDEMQKILERLGVTLDSHIAGHSFPEILVYVEGKTDKPVIESLVAWCRQKHPELPSVTVVANRDGRFEKSSIHAISRAIHGMNGHTRVVGIRDLDWYYEDIPSLEPIKEGGEGWELITLPCKELENIFCEPEFLFFAYSETISIQEIAKIVDSESQSDTLVRDWSHQVKPRIRDSLPNHYDRKSKEEKTDITFDEWRNNPDVRRRMVAGKELLKKVRERLRTEYQVNKYPQRMFKDLQSLTSTWAAIASTIFSGTDF